MIRSSAIAAAAVLATASLAAAQDVTVTIENLQGAGGLPLTPTFVGLHDGSFDLFDPGSAVSVGLEEVAELGSTATLAGELPAGAVTGDITFGAPPTIDPGETGSITLDSAGNRFLNFAAMVVPSNDLFVGNPTPIEIFDDMGNFNGPITITLFGSQVWDAGTEVNDFSNGPAFVAGVDATLGAEQNGVASLLFDDPAASAYLASIIGADTPVGEIAQTFDSSTALYRVTIVPEPGSIAGLALGGLFLRRRR
ncbi:MAG: spondin domain-containing protein [Planctomycetota bacterium]